MRPHESILYILNEIVYKDRRVVTSDNEWYNEWQQVIISAKLPFYKYCVTVWVVSHFITPKVIAGSSNTVIDVLFSVLKIYANLSRTTFMVFLKLSMCYYLLFIIKTCFYFFNEKQIIYFALYFQKDIHTYQLVWRVYNKPLKNN